ncbi:hypothetical protein CerSpe_235020 [Prunus speciosa]
MDELEKRFGSNLRLSEKERVGIRIAEDETIDMMKGSQLSLAARVLTSKTVSKEGFVSVFSRLWRGTAGVSIKEFGDGRFLIRFGNLKDKLRVLDMEPWTFREYLVVLAEVKPGMDARRVDLGQATFWVQLHGIPLMNMTTMVARKIGSLMGQVVEVDHAEGDECIGRFLRVRIRIPVDQPLMRGAFVAFPDEGSIWINFRYEYLPEYCFICGCLGHPSRFCVDKLEDQHGGNVVTKESFLAFAGLEAEEDMNGRRLRSNGRRSHTDSSSSPLEEGSGRDGSRRGGSMRYRRSDGSWRRDVVGDGGNRRGMVHKSRDLEDMASASGESRNHEFALADKIRRLREEEERERSVREEAWNLGILGRGGESEPIVGDGTSHMHALSPNGSQTQAGLEEGINETIIVSEENGLGIDLNVGMTVGCETEVVEEVVLCEHAQSVELGQTMQVQPASLTQGSDPFNLGPLIARIQPQPLGSGKTVVGKRRREESERVVQEKRSRVENPMHGGWSGRTEITNRELLFTDNYNQAVETGLNESPRAS